ncbi:MAG: AAA family ATPase [Proteobacteria bacterium]|nr:AAA family ATPase [Pseudomonadota bacterium]
MYHKYFGLRERPFQLVPNPNYLYLSKYHEEALAHLKYAISHGEGFAEITGEVGTGKTTLCRVFLESLNKNTEVAYIFNPNLSSVELIKAINDEFEIDSRADNTKELIDHLNQFLLKKKEKKKNIVLLIDEAQNLSKDVLEQLRILSNLETSTQKLLQIILVGQPELDIIINSHEMRQLAQRITIRCHLFPLDLKETRDYILHRIHVASQKPQVTLSNSAFRKIYRYSGGIPRLINILCDRAFLAAYVEKKNAITGKIVQKAIIELESKNISGKYFAPERRNPGLMFLLLLCVILIMYIIFYPDQTDLIRFNFLK